MRSLFWMASEAWRRDPLVGGWFITVFQKGTRPFVWGRTEGADVLSELGRAVSVERLGGQRGQGNHGSLSWAWLKTRTSPPQNQETMGGVCSMLLLNNLRKAYHLEKTSIFLPDNGLSGRSILRVPFEAPSRNLQSRFWEQSCR